MVAAKMGSSWMMTAHLLCSWFIGIFSEGQSEYGGKRSKMQAQAKFAAKSTPCGAARLFAVKSTAVHQRTAAVQPRHTPPSTGTQAAVHEGTGRGPPGHKLPSAPLPCQAQWIFARQDVSLPAKLECAATQSTPIMPSFA